MRSKWLVPLEHDLPFWVYLVFLVLLLLSRANGLFTEPLSSPPPAHQQLAGLQQCLRFIHTF